MIKPVKDRIAVELVDEPQSSIIVTPEIAKRKSTRGRVVAVGSTVENINVGDLVIFQAYKGEDAQVDGKPFLMLKQDDVLGIINQ